MLYKGMVPSLSPSEVPPKFVTAKCDYFVDVQLWPPHKLRPEAWLTNFKSDEMPFAVHLLNAFLYYSDHLIDHLFGGAFQSLSEILHPAQPAGFLEIQSGWRNFVDSLLIIPVEGALPNITDSGMSYAARARHVLGINESRILPAQQAVRQMLGGGKTVVFVDDFVGTGEQFLRTWNRRIAISESFAVTFERLSELPGMRFYYCPLICTEVGYGAIVSQCPKVVLRPAHVLSTRYNALASDSIIWPDSLRSAAYGFLRTVSERAGIPDSNGAEDDWRGYRQMGLSLAFANSVPDATMPLFYWEKNGWKPLIRRT